MINTAEVLNTADVTSSTAFSAITKYDFRRLKSYSDNLTDYHIILDLVPTITKLYFQGKMNLNLSPLQATILISLGLQYKTIDETSLIFPDLETNQILGIFKKIIKKTVGYMEGIMKAEIDSEIIDAPSKVVLNGIEGSMRDELNKVESEFKEKQKENAEKVKDLIKADDAEFSIKSNDFGDDVKLSGNTIVSIKRTIVAETPSTEKSGKKKKRKSEGPEKTKKKKKQPIS